MYELLTSPEVQPNSDYEYYEALLEESNMSQPARQGMSAEEFTAALANPEVAKTEVLINGERHVLPQLCPVEQFEWLNTDFYEKTFPDATEKGAVMHFADLPGIEPGPEVVERLQSLAEQGGVLVFDYPETTDPEYPARVEALLESLGIQPVEADLLGTQTYFAGRVVLKREHERLEKHVGLIPAFQKMIEDGTYDVARMENGASLKATVEPAQAQHMNRFYDEAFQVLNDHPCKQGLSPDEFLDMVVNDSDVAKIVNSKDGQVSALCIMGEGLEKFNWINPEYYKTAYPDKADGQVVYFPALAADPAKAGANTLAIVGLIAELDEAGDNEMLVAFDCCDMNNGFLDQALNAMINHTPQASIDIQQIAQQRYCAIKLSSQNQK